MLLGEYEIVYSSVGSLGQYLFRAKASKREDGCERTLISNVLSAWVGIRSLDPTEERIPLVLSFSTRKPNPSLQAQCVRWSEQHEDFVEDGSCMVLVHNSTQTICRCMGTGHYAVIGSTCDSQVKQIWCILTISSLALRRAEQGDRRFICEQLVCNIWTSCLSVWTVVGKTKSAEVRVHPT